MFLRSNRANLVNTQSEHHARINQCRIQAVRRSGREGPKESCGEIPQGKAPREAYCHKVAIPKRKHSVSSDCSPTLKQEKKGCELR